MGFHYLLLFQSWKINYIFNFDIVENIEKITIGHYKIEYFFLHSNYVKKLVQPTKSK